MYYAVRRASFLSHHGILGMKWGVRRYQNADGTLTAAGRKRQRKEAANVYKNTRKAYRVKQNSKNKELRDAYDSVNDAELAMVKHQQDYFKNNPPDSKKFKEDVEKALKTYISDDDEELRELSRMELDDYIKEGKEVSKAWIGEKAYEISQIDDPSYEKLYTEYLAARDNYDKVAKNLASKAYDSAGSGMMKKWMADDPMYKNTREEDVDQLAYLYRAEHEKSRRRR